MRAVVQTTFDYRRVAPAWRDVLKQRAEMIRLVVWRTAEDIMRIGEWLMEAKEGLKHGEWMRWLKAEFGWSDRTARSFMHVYECFKSEKISNLTIDLTALYRIAAPCTPEAVREEAIARARRGERITSALVRTILKEKAPPQPIRVFATTAPRELVPVRVVVTDQPAGEATLPRAHLDIDSVYDAIKTLAETELSPEDVSQAATEDPELLQMVEKAAAWLAKVAVNTSSAAVRTSREPPGSAA
jgi:hypothetical protein